MLARDFIAQTRIELNEKGEHWNGEELFIKLQRSYTALQYDAPFFISTETMDIKSGVDSYHLAYMPIKNVSLKVNAIPYSYDDIENYYAGDDERRYTFDGDNLLIYPVPAVDGTAQIVYRHEKRLENDSCHIELPSRYQKALRLMFMSEIHEKPTRNTKERNLSVHYLKLYEAELRKLRVENAMRPRNITTNYQRI